jgi:hypothetical protein
MSVEHSKDELAEVCMGKDPSLAFIDEEQQWDGL